MITVIEGKARKSKVVEEMVDEISSKGEGVVILDRVNVKSLLTDSKVSHFILAEDFHLYNIPVVLDNLELDDVSTVVVLFNIEEADLISIKRLTRKYNKNVIVTVQNNELDEIKIYELSR